MAYRDDDLSPHRVGVFSGLLPHVPLLGDRCDEVHDSWSAENYLLFHLDSPHRFGVRHRTACDHDVGTSVPEPF